MHTKLPAQSRIGQLRLLTLILCLALALPWLAGPLHVFLHVHAQGQLASAPAADKLPATFPLLQDSGRAALTQVLRKLQNSGRLMQTTAHPDDEDGGMLTLQARGRGTSVLLFTLTRGEGGQNKIGSSLFDSLGVLRTDELVASSKTYGVQQRFSRVADFGYSKTEAETLAKWQSPDGTPGGVALADMVRVIRTFRPDVLTARFTGTEADGHGHHQASALLTQEAFHAAADPKRFPDQIQQGLLPWQAKKLYNGVLPWLDKADYTVRFETSAKDPALGTSYVRLALEGLRHQLSQGAGSWTITDEPRYSKYLLTDSVLPKPAASTHEDDFFDGMDVTLLGLATRLGDEQRRVPFLRPALEQMQKDIAKAAKESESESGKATAPLLEAADALDAILPQVKASELSDPAKADLLDRLQEKQNQLADAIRLSANLTFDASVAPPSAAGGSPATQPALEAQAPTVAAPGQALTLHAHFHNGSRWKVRVDDITIDGPPSNLSALIEKSHLGENRSLEPGDDYYASFLIRIPRDAPFTRQFWHRDDPETSTLNTLDDASQQTLPFPAPPFRARITYTITGLGHEPSKVNFQGHALTLSQAKVSPTTEISTPVSVPFLDASGTTHTRPLAVGPAFSLLLDSPTDVLAAGSTAPLHVGITVRSNQPFASHGTLALALPTGWNSEPESLQVQLNRRGDEKHFEFLVHPANPTEGHALIAANLLAGGALYDLGYSLVTREDLDTFYYYQPAQQRVRIVNVKLPTKLEIGYITGAGDNIATALQQLGLNVHIISPEDLAHGDLSLYQTIVLGIRAYDVRKDVVQYNQRLLDFASQGGTLIVQYNSDVQAFNQAKILPYPANLTRARVSVEEAPVEILVPSDTLFHDPNPIVKSDFDGWVQERGLYFMESPKWDPRYQALLSCNDPGEAPQSGGLLRAHLGKGLYIYTGYAFFRQIPAGVPGAVRLFVNLLAQGHPSRTDAMPGN